MNGLTVLLLMIMTAVVTWGFTMVRISGQQVRLKAEIARIDRVARQEIQHWQDEAARARSHAAQVERDSKAWAAGRKQGRDDVISVMPLLIAAQEGKEADGSPTLMRLSSTSSRRSAPRQDSAPIQRGARRGRN